MPKWDTGVIGCAGATRGSGWSLPGTKLLTVDGVYVTNTLAANAFSSQIDARTWGFVVGRDIPANAKILGFEVTITRSGAGARDYVVQLLSNFTPTGDNKADTTTDWGSTDTTVTYGGPNDLWGWSLFTAPYTKASPHPSYLLGDPYGFGVRLRAKNYTGAPVVLNVDCITMKVYYQCYIIESSTEDGYLKFRNNTGRPLTYDSLDNTSDDVSSLNSSSTELTVDIGFGFFNTAPYLERKTMLSAYWGGNINTVVDYTPNGSAGYWNFYINYHQGDTLTFADKSGWEDTIDTGGLFWETGADPFTDGAGYYSWNVTSFEQWINKRTDVNGGYTNVVIDPTNTGNDISPESTYILLDSKDKASGYPMRLTIVTDEQDPLDAGCEINTTLAGMGQYALSLTRASSQYAYITDAAQTNLDISGDLTIECWVKFNSLPTAAGEQFTFVGKYLRAGNQRSYEFGYAKHASNGTSYLEFNASQDGASMRDTIWNIWTPNVGQWYHLAVTFDVSEPTATEVTFYVDGVALSGNTIGLNNNVSSIYNGTADFTIGCWGKTGTTTEFFHDGLIDNVRLWSVVRTPTEIAANMNTRIDSATGLVGSWNMDNNYQDSSGNSNHLTSSGGPVFVSGV